MFEAISVLVRMRATRSLLQQQWLRRPETYSLQCDTWERESGLQHPSPGTRPLPIVTLAGLCNREARVPESSPSIPPPTPPGGACVRKRFLRSTLRSERRTCCNRTYLANPEL